jgi:hypothetical protein
MIILAMLVCQAENRKQWRKRYLLLVHSLLAVVLVLLEVCEGFHLAELVCTMTLGNEILARIVVHHHILGSVRLEVVAVLTIGERVLVFCGESMTIVASMFDRRRNLKVMGRRAAVATPTVCVVWGSWDWIHIVRPRAVAAAPSMWVEVRIVLVYRQRWRSNCVHISWWATGHGGAAQTTTTNWLIDVDGRYGNHDR